MDRIIRTCSAVILALSGTAAWGSTEALDHYVQARMLDAAGNGGAAARSYGLALSGAPTEARVALRAYRQAIEAGDYKLAVRAANALNGLGKLTGDVRLLLYLDTLKRGDLRGAAVQLDKMEEEAQNFDFLTPILRGWLRHESREADGLGFLDNRARESLTAAYAREQRVYLLLAMKQNADGLAAARALASSDNRGLWLRLSAAAKLAANKDVAAARDLLGGTDAVIARARALLDAKASLPGGVDDANEAAGVLIARVAADLVRDNSDIGLLVARLAAYAAPDHPQVRLVLAQALSSGGYSTVAIAELERAPLHELFDNAAREIRFSALQRGGRDEDALRFAEQQAARSDADMFDHARHGEALSRLKRHGEAASAYKRAIDVAGADATSWNLWLLYGGALDAGGDWERAKPALQRAVQLAPDQPQALNHLGYAMLERGDNLAEATRLVAKAAALRPNDPAITDSLGYAFFLQGQTAESIAVLERAVASDPREAALGEHLGDAYWKAGRKVDARYAWAAALIQAEGEDQSARLTSKLADGLK